MKSRLWGVAGNLVWTVAWVVLAWQFTTMAGIGAAVAGAVAGMAIAGVSRRFAIRELTLAAGGALAGLLFQTVAELLRGRTTLPSLIGAGAAYSVIEMLLWGGLALGVTTIAQALRRRFPEIVSLEILFAGAATSSVLAAHRDGAQHHPYFLVDPLLVRGYDPLIALMAAGLLLGAAALVWLSTRSPERRRWRDAIVLLLLVLGLFLFVPRAARKFLTQEAAGGGGDAGQSSGQKNRAQDPNPDNPGQNGAPQPVAIVTFHDDYDPPSGMYYFRQLVLSAFRNNRLAADSSRQFDREVFDSFPAALTNVAHGAGAVPARVRATITLITPHSRPFGLIDVSAYGPAPNPDPQRFDRAYTTESVSSTKEPLDLLRNPAADAAGLAHYLEPPADPRFAAIVNEALEWLKPEYREMPVARAFAVKHWLDENTVYNLRAKHDATDDPVTDFLFGDRNGYCVHLAQSAALLYRVAGVPSRISQGYAVESRQRANGSTLMIRDSDAHAWPEIYVQGAGWMTLDITPNKIVSPPPPPADQEQQRMLGRMARPINPDGKQNQPGESPASGARAAVSKALLAALLATLISLYAAKIWRWLAVHVCAERSLRRVAFRAALDRLADVSLVRQPAQTREQFSETVAPWAPSLEPLTRMHVESGMVPLSHGRDAYRSLLRQLSQELRGTVPAWRRALGCLDPFAWTRVR